MEHEKASEEPLSLVRREVGLEETLKGWTDVEKMKAHAEAINRFGQVYTGVLRDAMEDWNRTPWEAQPNPYFNRTKEGILLLVRFHNGIVHSASRLYTPFGECVVVGGGLWSCIQKRSQLLMERISEIADAVPLSPGCGYHYMNTHGPDKRVVCKWFQGEPYTDIGAESRLFLLKFKPELPFSRAVNTSDVHLFWTVNEGREEEKARESLASHEVLRPFVL